MNTNPQVSCPKNTSNLLLNYNSSKLDWEIGDLDEDQAMRQKICNRYEPFDLIAQRHPPTTSVFNFRIFVGCILFITVPTPHNHSVSEMTTNRTFSGSNEVTRDSW